MKNYKVYLEDDFNIKQGCVLSSGETEEDAIKGALVIAKHNHPDYNWKAYKVEAR